MQFHCLSSGRVQLIALTTATLLLACSDDSEATSEKDAAAEHAGEHDHEAPKKQASQSTSDKQSAVKQADAGHPDAAAGSDKGKSEQNDKQSAQADSGKAAEQPSQNKAKDTKKNEPGKSASQDSLKVSVRFQAKLGKSDFSCSHKIPSQGTTNTTVTPTDFRLFVHALELIKDDGSKVPVTLNVREPWQSDSLALLDFEDKTGRCTEGTEGINTAITGTVAPGSYKGIRFIVGVPEDLDHKDQAAAAEPLESAGGLGPQGDTGYRFAKVALAQLTAAGSPAGTGLFELGSTQCSGSPVKCDKANRSVVELAAFDIEKNSVVIDAAALFSPLDLSQSNDCHSTEKVCAGMFSALGVDFATGQPKAGQTLFRVE